MNNNNCNLTTCHYNQSGKCTNEDKRKECVEVSKRVCVWRIEIMSEESKVYAIVLIILLSCAWISILIYPIFYKYIPLIWGWVSDKMLDFLKIIKCKMHHLPMARRKGKRK